MESLIHKKKVKYLLIIDKHPYFAMRNLYFVAYRFDEFFDFWIERGFRHLGVYYDVHIACFSITRATFFLDLELGARLGACFDLEGEIFPIYSLHGY